MVAHGFYKLNIDDQQILCMHVDHHFAHNAYAFYMSPFKDAITFSLDVNDNMGNNHSIYYFNDADKQFMPLRKGGDFGVGGFYSAICDFLGFYPSLTDAGKVMALASLGKPRKQKIEHIIWPNVIQMGDLFHGDQYSHLLYNLGIKSIPENRNLFPQLKGEGGIKDKNWLDKNDWNSKLSKQIAADAQYILEQSVINMIDKIEKINSSKNLCLAGGTFLNCVMNGIIEKHSKFNVFAAPACGDDGLTIGAALFLANKLKVNKKREINVNSTGLKKNHSIRQNIEGGRSYYQKDIESALKGYQFERKIKKITNNDSLNKTVSKLLEGGKIVAWFKGGSEIGPRALGHRSILADPRNKKMKGILNEKVKHRESFRPFAPIVLKEHVTEWFDVNDKDYPFMLFSFKCKKPDLIPSAVHEDDTARIQTVDEKNNPEIYKLLKEFHNNTEVPILINTSFNVMGEPIVETPYDALECMDNTEIDVLVIENYIVEKE